MNRHGWGRMVKASGEANQTSAVLSINRISQRIVKSRANRAGNAYLDTQGSATIKNARSASVVLLLRDIYFCGVKIDSIEPKSSAWIANN